MNRNMFYTIRQIPWVALCRLNNLHKHALVLSMCICAALAVKAQPNITKVEYYIDKDPGFGKATAVTITPGTDLSNVSFDVNMAALTTGTHVVFVRSQDANGAWSTDNRYPFLKPYASVSSVLLPNIKTVEYYIDKDPGFGKGTAVTVTPGTDLSNVAFNVDMAPLTTGVHVVFVRSQDENGAWSIDNRYPFLKPYATMAGVPLPNIKKVEYYIDKDPGFGKATALTITPGTDLGNVSFNVDMSVLTEGVHVILVRSQDENGAWSTDNRYAFLKPYTVNAAATLPDVTRAEYFVDKDPGYGKGTAITLTPAQQLADLSFTIDLTKVPPGDHIVSIRTLDANGRWSFDNKWLFNGGSGALPLTLLAFTAQAVKNNEVQLDWTTVAETNTKQFTILRSKNGGIFDSIGLVAAAGNSNGKLNYRFTDGTPITGISYYRLKMQDLDGKATYSNVEPVLITDGVSKPLSVYPNPATSTVTVSFTSAAGGKYSIQLTDLLGKEVRRINGVSTIGVNTVQLNVQQYAKGTYLITLFDEEHGKQTLKIEKF